MWRFPPSADPQPVRSVGAYPAALDALADWWAPCGLTTVAWDSTGVYWRPLFALLEPRGFEVLLVAPQQVQNGDGRRVTSTIARGDSASTRVASWPVRFGLPTRAACCAVLCGHGPGFCPMRGSLASLCNRP